MARFIITTAEMLVCCCEWEVEAKGREEAEEKFGDGERKLISEEDGECMSMDILSTVKKD